MGLKDLFSTFHEKNVSHIDRKKLGQFYTHKELVEYIYSKIPVNKKSKILDPCVGAGAFLTSININKEISKNTCPICLENQIEICLNPCGHTSCNKCILSNRSNIYNNKCYICRTPVNEFIKIYFSL